IFLVAAGGGMATALDGSFSTFLTTSGALTVVVGFALRELILDFFCGIAINLEQPFKMDDWVEVQKDVVAKVVEINWRATRLLTDSHKTIIVPNRMMASANLINYSLPTPVYRENMKLVLGNEHDPERVANILMAAILSTPQVLAQKKNRVRIDGFNERGTIWALKFWIGSYADRVPSVHNVYANCIHHLHAAGIEIPYSRNEMIMSGRSLSALHDAGRQRDTMTVLRRVPLFNALRDDELKIVAAKLNESTLSSGTTVVRQGDAGQSLFVLVEGLLSVSIDGKAVGSIQPGNVFGEMSLLTGEPRKATISAHTDAVVLEIVAEQIGDVMTARPEIVDELARIMARNRQTATAAGKSPAEEKSASSVLAEKIRTFFRVFATR
ncbi:MAG: mechanosensitive ion channel family protein, partial [Magnetospirillum sp.]|nr:mechanosensitive ion channel family protein [Magnetospirillum sp.]